MLQDTFVGVFDEEMSQRTNPKNFGLDLSKSAEAQERIELIHDPQPLSWTIL